ncbi:hypothetical protein V9L05_22040 (plasmid) [Bernardetia sp. Wsw4-3y2]|uniref:hypothetical protein n=1 Tax=unclassified Bernardetia TaxID=2647129 RepID=UPI0030CDF631
MHTLKINLFSFLPSFSSSKKVVSDLKSSPKKPSKKENSEEPSTESDLPASQKESAAIYYLPVHLM